MDEDRDYITIIVNLLRGMFSLNDEIKKFEILAHTLKDDTMAIEDKFIGGGIAMKDLLQENSFIMSEMRKMKEVFLNYCQLNDKIYKKIIEHEISARDHQQKLGSILPKVDRKLEDFTIEVSKLKEITVVEIHKNREFIQEIINTLGDKIDERVHESEFDQKVRKLFQAFEEEQQSSQSEGCLVDQKGNVIVGASGQNSKKRKGGYSMEEIQVIAKMHMTPEIALLEEKIKDRAQEIEYFKEQIVGIKVRFNKLELYEQTLAEDIVQAKRFILEESKKYASEADAKILRQLNEKINEDVWAWKFEQFNANQLRPEFQKISQNFIKASKDLKDEINKLDPRFIQIGNKITILQKKDGDIEASIKELEEMISLQKQQLEAQIEKQHENIRHVDQLRINGQGRLQKRINQLGKEAFMKMGQIQQSVSNIIDKTKQVVFEKVEQEYKHQNNQIKGKINFLIEQESKLKEQVKKNMQAITVLKDLVATKANFTDLVFSYDKKADRVQLDELKELYSGDSPRQRTRNTSELLDPNYTSRSSRIRKDSFKRTSTIGLSQKHRYKQEDGDLKFPNGEWGATDVSQQLRTIQPSHRPRHKSGRSSTAKTIFVL